MAPYALARLAARAMIDADSGEVVIEAGSDRLLISPKISVSAADGRRFRRE